MKQTIDEITQYVAKVYQLSKSQAECLSFGIQVTVEIGINIILSVIILGMVDMLWEGVFFFCIFIPVRTYSGGYHSNTYLKCLFLSILTMSGVMFACKVMNFPCLVLVGIIIVENLLIAALAPAISAERPVTKQEYQKFSKKLKIILTGVLFLSICLAVIGLKKMLNIVCLSLLLILTTLIMGKIKYKQYQEVV